MATYLSRFPTFNTIQNYAQSFFTQAALALLVAWRSLKIDFRYKFQLGVEIGWSSLNVIVFVGLGAAWSATGGDVQYVPYDMISFFIVGTAFFTVFNGVTDTTVTAIQEESQLGTMGFLITNNVTPSIVLFGRYIAATIKWTLVLLLIVVPALLMRGMLPSSPELYEGILATFIISWLFFAGITFLIASVSLLFKKTTTFNKVSMYLVRVIVGGIVPIFSFDSATENSLGFKLSNILIWFPATFSIELMRWIFTANTSASITTGGISKDGHKFSSFSDVYGVPIHSVGFGDLIIQFMLLLSFIFFICSWIIVDRATRIARKWGTLEFY